MSVETAFQRLVEANPVPHPAALTDEVDLDALLIQTPERNLEMQTRETENIGTAKERTRGSRVSR